MWLLCTSYARQLPFSSARNFPAAGRSEDGGLSDSSAAFVAALVQDRGLHAMALIVAEVEQTQQWPAAAEVRRLFQAISTAPG